MAPRLKLLMSSGSKKKEPRYEFSFSLKKSLQTNPLQVPQQGPLWRELPVYRAFLHICQIPHKNFPKYRNVSLLSKALGKECSTKAGPYGNIPTSRALVSISFGFPSTGALLPGSPYRAPSERDSPLLEPPSSVSQKSMINEAPSRFPNGVPMERDAILQNFPLHNLQGPQYRSPL